MTDRTILSLSVLIQQVKAKLAAMSPEQRAAMREQHRQGWVRGEMRLGLDAEERAWHEPSSNSQETDHGR